MKDIYHNQRRWESWKENNFKKTPEGVRKEDWKILIDFLKDMELGINTPKGKKGKRDFGTLLNLSSHNQLFLKNFKKPLVKVTKKDLHLLESEIQQGKILKRSKQKYTAFGNYIKDFKVFWNWGLRNNLFKENIIEDITSKTDKPAWVYLTEAQIKEFFNHLSLEYRTYCWFLYDTGMRVTEAQNIKINNFSNDFSQVTIPDEIKDSDMILGEDKTKLYKLEEEISNIKLEQVDFKNLIEAQDMLIRTITETYNEEILKRLPENERNRILANIKKSKGISILGTRGLFD